MLDDKPVATEYSWLPLTASVLVAVMRPGATFTICRSAPADPTDTTPMAVPAKPPNVYGDKVDVIEPSAFSTFWVKFTVACVMVSGALSADLLPPG